MKKRRKVIKIIGMIVLGMIVLENLSRLTGNVLDMIGWSGYRAMPQFEGVAISNQSLSNFWYDEYLERYDDKEDVRYDDDYLREGESIWFTFYDRPITDASRNNVYISAYKDITDTVMISIHIKYDYARRTIIYRPLSIYVQQKPEAYDTAKWFHDEENIRRLMAEYNITEEDIREFQEYVLYDVILKSWQRASGSNYDSEKRKLQRCRVEDLTFEFE